MDKDRRHPYEKEQREVFDVDSLVSREPFLQFQHWLSQATCLQGIEANAMAIATATRNGMPSVRQMLMKSFSKEQGFIFFTNYESRKAKELVEENPYCSLVFHWRPLKKSVRIEGTVVRIPEAESERYFQSRPRDSQISALVSHQSAVIPNREVLDAMNAELALKYDGSVPIPKPEHWGGYESFRLPLSFGHGHRTGCTID